MRTGTVYIKDKIAGKVWEHDGVYGFAYDKKYSADPEYGPVSLTLPVRAEAYTEKTMIPFFDGLIPEGWLLDIAVANWKLNERDRMELLLTVCKDCIGDVSIERTKDE